MVKYIINLDNPTYPCFSGSGIADALSNCACCLETTE